MYLNITDHGDESVGIFPQSWEVPCPFEKDDMDGFELDSFKANIKNIYCEFCNGLVTAMYDFEIKKLEDQISEAFQPTQTRSFADENAGCISRNV